MYKNKSLRNYLDDLAAKVPAPGGGSAAALAGSLGVSLISMVVQFTLGKEKYKRYEGELRKILKRSEGLRRGLLRLTDEDVIAYKSKDAKKCLAVPVEVCRLAARALALCPSLVKKGNVRLASDVAVAAALLEASFISALYNIEINIAGSAPGKRQVLLAAALRKQSLRIKMIRRETEAAVGKIIRGKASR